MSVDHASSSVVIVDTGGANLASLKYAFQRLNVKAQVSIDAAVISTASHVVLPGVGAAGDAMQRLEQHRLNNVIKELTQPVLGICLGMHLLANYSEEDDTPCLGVFNCDVRRIPASDALVVPHMGWNQTRQSGDSLLFDGYADPTFHYYVHSYAIAAHALPCAATYDYGERYAAVVQQGNFFATQFHPERSASEGQRLLKNFLSITACN
ncbi:MAG: imidazole glycerol phosphate synthase subunit HisH [Pseudomonadota bacterium]